MNNMCKDQFWSVELWSITSRPFYKVKVWKSDASMALSGVNWLSLAEYPTRKAAMAGAREARAMLVAGETEDTVITHFGTTV